MKTIRAMRSAAAAMALTAGSRAAIAAGDSGTGAMGEMQVGPGMILAFVGALVVLGLVLWAMAKFMSK